MSIIHTPEILLALPCTVLMKTRTVVILSCLVVLGAALLATNPIRKRISLPSSKTLITPVPGNPQPMGAFPVNIAVSPDQKYAAILEAGYGTVETELKQSVAVLDFTSGEITRFADPRLGPKAKQSFFLGLAWSSDGKHIYAPVGSITDPTGTKRDEKDKNDKIEHLGNGVIVYAFDAGKITPERFIKISPQPLAPGKKRGTIHKEAPAGTLVPYPAGMAVVKRDGGDQLLIADNLSDDVLLMDAASGNIIHRFDVSTGEYVPGAYPYGVVVNKAGTAAWVSLWNSSKIIAFDLVKNTVHRSITISDAKTASAPHPTAMALLPSGDWLFVALSNEDRVAVIHTETDTVTGYLPTRLPNQVNGGAYPDALAFDSSASRLYAANAANDAVAVFDIRNVIRSGELGNIGPIEVSRLTVPSAFLPTEWYPTALAVHGDELLIATGKGTGTGPNNIPKKVGEPGYRKGYTYIGALLKGSLARVNLKEVEPHLKQLTDEVIESNLMNGHAGTLPFKDGKNPIKHVIYIIKENRTYDQLFGDLGVGNGDPSLTMYGKEVTPNQHALALQFGVLDNFYDSGEVSGDGHVWSNAAITSDYTEKTWQIGYRGLERTYDYEGQVARDYPIELGIPDVNEPGTGYLWTNLARNKKTYRHFGEYISTHWCDRGGDDENPQEGTPLAVPESCAQKEVKPGEPFPKGLGFDNSEPSPYPWPVPLLAKNIATKPELAGHFDQRFPDFRLEFPDQLRADEFIREFHEWTVTRAKSKRDTMPQFITLRLPNDHTSGTKAGVATPEAAIADNDLAVGRVVEAVSNSPYWDDTAIFVLEDDAQDGTDHVDAHRSIALVVSKYSPRQFVPEPYGKDAPEFARPRLKSFVDSHFYTTVNMIHTMEVLLGLPPMNNNDAQAPIMAGVFAGPGTQPAFKADYRNRDNKLIYRANQKNSPGAKESAAMDFSHADHVDTAVLNAILWRERMGNKQMPEPKHTIFPATAGRKVDDDD
jgi:DNA-binding beta-propeller fold protein YncE